MQLTVEQKAIVEAEGDLKINAVAGSGKTSTLLAYAAAQPANARGLYLAFNKTVKLEARERFAAAGLLQVRVETAHSLAYGNVVRNSNYRVRANSYRPYELSQLLDLEGEAEIHCQSGSRRSFAFVLASHVARVLAAFCNSAVATVHELHYASTVEGPKARDFAETHSELIERKTRQLLKMLNTGAIEITHDFYLKKFQLGGYELGFDYILFDEAQDASGCMLQWFMSQRGTKIMVGDTHQQIYAWRGAVNSLEAVDFPTLPLTTSFRFAQPVAALASAVLAFKAPGGSLPVALRVPLTGAGRSQAEKTKAVIGRSSMGLLVKAISYIAGPHAVQRIYFEGNLRSYIYGTEGASLYDVLYLFNGDRSRVRDPLLATMSNMVELEEYADQTGDRELQLMIELVQTYENDLFNIIADLKRRQVADNARDTAQLYFSTVHRCKGLEYDVVELAPDFLTNEEVTKWHMRQFSPEKPTPGEVVRFNEQVNLLYVAVTRTKHKLWLSEESVPTGHRFDGCPELVAYPGVGNTYLTVPAPPRPAKRTATAPVAQAAVLTTVSRSWSEQDEKDLTLSYCRDESVSTMARKLGRGMDDVRDRIALLDLDTRFNLGIG